jgi:hypothetical protein
VVSVASESVVLADQIELLVCAFPDENFSRRRIDEIAEKYWDADTVQVSYAFDVLDSRYQILGSKYPFRISRSFIVKDGNSSLYEALLSITRTNVFFTRDGFGGTDTTKSFERLVEFCLSSFYGENTRTVNFGWPSEVGRPKEFSPAIGWLAALIGIPVGSAYRQPRRKDGGVDVVVWRTFADGRPGVPLMLVQATVQADISAKARDVDRRMWSGWLATDVEPLVALAVPGSLNNTEVWNEISRNSLLLDRIRLTSMAPEINGTTADAVGIIIHDTHTVVREFIERG